MEQEATQVKNPIGKIEPVEIIDEMQRSYLDYAMSVIVSRALPDIKDGLKPVQRRILYAMGELGLTHEAKFRKSAAVVGEVLGKYHPHGDSPVYEALVRLAQSFTLRYPLIDGQGNFGSVDGDPPAAMRYTEVRLAKIAKELLLDLDKDTVEFGDNFDGTRREPLYLPGKLPNLLLNGGSGIAVGMATNIPPHNLGEVCDAIIYLINNPLSTVEDLMKFIKGPDFPTGGSIYDLKEITAAYATGRGKILMRARAEIEETSSGRFSIIVSEIPYQVNKSTLITRIAELTKEKKLEGISDLRDESDRRGMRIVIELKRDARPKNLLNLLYKHTSMQLAFNVNLVALVDGSPQTLTLKATLEGYIRHRQVVVTRRTKFELEAAKNRAHILEGLKIAVDNIDAVIETIKKSEDAEEARTNLMKKFVLSEIQATAILDLQLRRLAHLERQKIEEEYRQVLKTITYLEGLLAHPKKILNVIEAELEGLKKDYGDLRRTKVYPQAIGEFSEEDLISSENVIVTTTKEGYIKRSPTATFRTQGRGGKGVSGISLKEADSLSQILAANTLDNILFFTNLGKVYQLKVYDLPEGLRSSKGTSIINLIDIDADEKITSILTYGKESRAKYLFMCTKGGTVKKTNIEDFAHIRRSGMIAIELENYDELGWVKLTEGTSNLIIVTDRGGSIKFSEKDIRPMGRGARGVIGIKLGNGGAKVIAAYVAPSSGFLLTVSERGFGKKTDLLDWPIQKRAGSGVKAAEVTSRNGKLVAATILKKEDKDLVITSNLGQVIKLPIKEIPILKRQTQGVILMRLSDSKDKVSSIVPMAKETKESKESKIPAD